METIPANLPRGEDGYVKWDEIDIDSLKLPAGDDMGIASDDEDVNVEEVKTESGFGNVVVVDNLPKVPSAKVEKLSTVLRKIFGQIGAIREGGLVMPVDDTGTTKGFAFVEFHGAAEAHAAREQTDGYKLDKAHVFKTSSFDDFAKFERVPDAYEPPKPKPYAPKENTQSYMLDERGRDQYAIRFGDSTEIHWNDAQKSEPVEVYKRDFWTESYVQWSPRGNFLATVHRQGVALWGGPEFVRFQKFSHNGVQFIEFSPCERFLASGSTHDEGREATVLVNFFDTRSGTKLRSFQGPISEFAAGGGARGGLTWPVFKWGGPSEDGAFFARMKKDQISVYEAPAMTLVDKKSITLEGVTEFCWSPADPILSVFQPEQGGGNQPARVSLIQLPSKKELRSKNLFSVSDVKMYWQQSGDYFAVKVDHHTKSKKSIFSGFELFRVKEPNCPMEVLELPDKNQKIVAFAWEPKGHRFAVIHGDGARPDVSFYTMIDKDSAINKVKLIGTLKNKTANHLFWSPCGGTIVLAGLKTMNGQFEFFNVDEMETMASAEHFMATDVEWDPTGRYVTTAVTSVHQMENGFHVWTFNGKLLYKHGRERFYQFLWRPRAPSLLGAEKEAEIAKNLKKYSKRFEELDDKIRNAQDSHLAAEKQGVLDEWNRWVAAKKAELETPAHSAKVEALMRARYPGWTPGGDADVVEEQVEVEEILSVEEEPYVGGMM